MAVVFDNNISTTLAADISDSASSMTVDSTAGWPAVAGGDHAWLTIESSAGVEVVRTTNRIGAVVEIERGQDGTGRLAHAAGAVVEMRVCAALLRDIQGGGTGTITHHLYFGASTTALAAFDATTLAALSEVADAPGQHDVSLDATSLADGWVAYLVTEDPSTITRVFQGNLEITTFHLPANRRTAVIGGETLHIYSAPNQRGGITLSLSLEIVR